MRKRRPMGFTSPGVLRRISARGAATAGGAMLSLVWFSCVQAAGEFDLEAANLRYEQHELYLERPADVPEPVIDHSAPEYTDPEVAKRYFEELTAAYPRAAQYEIENLQSDSVRDQVEDHLNDVFFEEALSTPGQLETLLDDIARGELDPALFDMYVNVVRILFDRTTVDALRSQAALGLQVDAAIAQLSDGRASREDYIRSHPEDTVLAEIQQQRNLIESGIRRLRGPIELRTATAEQEREWAALMQRFNSAFCSISSADSFYSEVDDQMAQDSTRQDVYSQIFFGAQAVGGFSEEERQARSEMYQVAGAIVELQHLQTYIDIDIEWLEWVEDMHLTATGEVIGNDNENTERYKSLIDLMESAGNNVYFYEAMVASAEQYLARNDLTPTQREIGRQILQSSRRNLQWEAQTIRNSIELIMGGVAFDIVFMGPAGKLASAAAPVVARGARRVGTWVWDRTAGWIWRQAADSTAARELGEMAGWVWDAVRASLDDLRQGFSDSSGSFGDQQIPRAEVRVDDPDAAAILQLPIGEQLANVPLGYVEGVENLARQNGAALGIDPQLVESAINADTWLGISEINVFADLVAWARRSGVPDETIERMIADAGIFADDVVQLVAQARGAILAEVVRVNRGVVVLERVSSAPGAVVDLTPTWLAEQEQHLQRVFGEFLPNIQYRDLGSDIVGELHELKRILQDNNGVFPSPDQLSVNQVRRINQLAAMNQNGLETLYFFNGFRDQQDDLWELGTGPAREWVSTFGSAPADVGQNLAEEIPATVRLEPVSFADLVGPNGTQILDAATFDDLVPVPPIPVQPPRAPMTLADLVPRFTNDRASLETSAAGQIGQGLEQHELVLDLWDRIQEYFTDSTSERAIVSLGGASTPCACSCEAAELTYDYVTIGDQQFQLSIYSPSAFASANAVNFDPNLFRVKQQPDAPVPVDPVVDWGLERIGLSPGGPADTADSSDDVVVAIIDSGINWHHPNLSPDQLWKNADEIPANGIDDDQNGFIDDLIGWNFVAHNNLPLDGDGHGTFVAGIIASESAGEGEPQGVNPHAKLMIIRALDDAGNSNAFALARAVTYAADNGADIINMSVGGWQHTDIERAAIEYARQRGVLVVVAAGNLGALMDDYAPASIDGVLAVAATDDQDARAEYSNYGSAVAIAAPGTNIVSLRAPGTHLMANVTDSTADLVRHLVGADYLVAAGTSFAVPFVSGVASLLLQNDPSLTAEQLERMLVQSARDIEDPGTDQFTGYGLLDAAAALQIDPDFYVDGAIEGVAVVQEGGQPALQVLGTADANEFERAWVELGEGDSPDDWNRTDIELSRPVAESGPLGLIGVDEISGSTQWTLRLIVEHENGRQREARFLLTLG